MSASSDLDSTLIDTPDASDDDFSNEDVDSDYQSCESLVSDGPAEDVEDEVLEILQYSYEDRNLEPVKASDVQDLLGPSLTSTGWFSLKELDRWCNEAFNDRERCRDAMAVLSEIVGGVAEEWWHTILSYEERHGVMYIDYWSLQVLVTLIMSSTGASANTFRWQPIALYIPSQRMIYQSYSSNLLEGRIVRDLSPDRPAKDLAEVMRILLPYFREMKARLNTLSSNVGYSSDSASIVGPSSLVNLITCLDVAESVAKLIPVFGDVLEGACGILRKTVQAAEGARAARDECRALAEHTASITLAILHEIGPSSTLSRGDFNRIWDLHETIKLVDCRVQSLSKLGRTKYFFDRSRINAEVMKLRAKVDDTRIAFNIGNDISTTRLLTDLRDMHIRLASRVEDIYERQKDIFEGQTTTHHMLRTILVKVNDYSSGGAYINPAD